MKNRPVVVLKNGCRMVCYKRPGLIPEIHAAFIKQYIVLDQPPFPFHEGSRRNFFDLQNPRLCSKHADDLQALFRTCEVVGLLSQLYLEVITHAHEYLTISKGIPRTQDSLGEPPEISFTPLGLSECACKEMNRFTSKRRAVFEARCVEHIKATVAKHETVKIVSLGSGNLLQEWMLLGQLIKEGYSDFELVLVDPMYTPDALQADRPFGKFQAFYRKLPAVKMKIATFQNVHVCPIADKAHAVLAIDIKFADTPLPSTSVRGSSEFLACLNLLGPNGKLFLGIETDWIISRQDVVPVFYPSRRKTRSFMAGM